jgi:hypothetical protein
LQHTQPPEPSESAPDDLLSRTDVTDTEADFPSRAAPAPARGRPLSDLTTTNNSLGLDVGAVSGYPPSSTLAPSKPTGWRWSGRDPDIDKSVPFLTSTPPLSPHKQAPRTTPASIRQPVSHPVAISSTPRRSPADLRTANGRAADQDDALNQIRMAQDERSADQFRNARLLQRCFDVWKQGYDWVIVRPSRSTSSPTPRHHIESNFPLSFPTSRRQRQLKSPTHAIHSSSASSFTSGALRWHEGAREWHRRTPAPTHTARRRRSPTGMRTCRRGGRPRGALTCACACIQCEVCAKQRYVEMRGRAGASCTRAASCSSASMCASSRVALSGGRSGCGRRTQ